MDRTTEAASRQIAAMGCEVFEIGLLPESADTERSMLPLLLDGDALLRSLRCLRYESRSGRKIYNHPNGGAQFESCRRLSREAVVSMKKAGSTPQLESRHLPATIRPG